MPPGPPLIAFTESGGRLWFGYPNDQISSLSASIAETFGMNEGVDVGVVRSINQVRGTIWIGGTTGLEYLKSGRFMPVNLVDGTKLEGVVGIVEGAGGDIWLNTTGGAFRLPRSEIHLLKTDPLHRVVTNQFTYLDRIPSLPDQIRPLPTALRRGDGPLYFATRASVVWTDPSKISLNSIPPNVVIRSVSADGREKVDPSGSELRVGAGGLTVKYTASSLVIPQRVTFRYRLKGLDNVWQEGGTQRQLTFQRLPPGHYTLQVIAANNDGIWNTNDAQVSFYIQPTLVQRTSFKVFCVFAFLCLLWLLYWVRVQQITRSIRKKLLQRVEERESIARDLHDTFLQGIQGLLLSFHTATSLAPRGQPSRAMLEDVLHQSDRVMQEGRILLTQLRSYVSQSDELSEALAAAGTEFGNGQSTGFKLS